MKKQIEIKPWDEPHKNTCQYCGSILSEKKVDYCSEECRKNDSIWHRV